jgi:hypothetical protein
MGAGPLARSACPVASNPAGAEHNELLADGARCRWHILELNLPFGKIWIHQKSNHVNFGHQLAQELKPLRTELPIEQTHPGHIPAGPGEARDQAGRDRIGAAREDNRNACSGGLGGDRRGRTAGRGYHCHMATNQIGRQHWQTIVLIVRPSVFNRKVLPLDVASFGKATTERG